MLYFYLYLHSDCHYIQSVKLHLCSDICCEQVTGTRTLHRSFLMMSKQIYDYDRVW